jgi:hypothetical protein
MAVGSGTRSVANWPGEIPLRGFTICSSNEGHLFPCADPAKAPHNRSTASGFSRSASTDPLTATVAAASLTVFIYPGNRPMSFPLMAEPGRSRRSWRASFRWSFCSRPCAALRCSSGSSSTRQTWRRAHSRADPPSIIQTACGADSMAAHDSVWTGRKVCITSASSWKRSGAMWSAHKCICSIAAVRIPGTSQRISLEDSGRLPARS